MGAGFLPSLDRRFFRRRSILRPDGRVAGEGAYVVGMCTAGDEDALGLSNIALEEEW